MVSEIILQDDTHENILLYIDILGSEELEKNNDKDLAELINIFSNANSSFSFSVDHVTSGMTTVKNWQPEISSFSDHICISFSINNIKTASIDNEQNKTFLYAFVSRLIQYAIEYHYIALRRNLLLRGAITYGRLSHQGNKIHGPALNEAVKLEERHAVYPRIILSDSFVDFYRNKSGHTLSNLYVENDFDGIYFINYLKCMTTKTENAINDLAKIKRIIQHNLQKMQSFSDFGKKIKWQWLAKKFNIALDNSCQKQSEYNFKDTEKIKNFNVD